MIRKIPVAQLTPGMYVADLHKSWWQHMLWRQQFLVENQADILRIRRAGITEVSIDTERGNDLPPPPLRLLI